MQGSIAHFFGRLRWLYDQFTLEDVFADVVHRSFILSVMILASGLVIGGYFAVIIGVPLSMATELLLEGKDRAITGESVMKRRYMVYGAVFAIVLLLSLLLTCTCHPISDFSFVFLNAMIISVILAVLMVFPAHRYLNSLYRWVNQGKPNEEPTSEASVGQAKPKASRKKGELPPLVLKSDEPKDS